MSNHLKTLSKSANELIVGNYIVLFGGKDLAGEFFTKNTRLESTYTDIGTLYLDFEHGQDPDGAGMDDNAVIGAVDWKSARVDDKGVFVERMLNRRAQYVDYLAELIDAGIMGTSSEAIRGSVAKGRDGEITAWPLKRDSLTLTPMEPRMIGSNVLAAAKSLSEVFPHNKSLASMLGLEVADPIKSIEAIQTMREAETYLRDADRFSRSQAAAFISRIKSIASQRDSDELGELKSALQRLKSTIS